VARFDAASVIISIVSFSDVYGSVICKRIILLLKAELAPSSANVPRLRHLLLLLHHKKGEAGQKGVAIVQFNVVLAR
jgi:hypothetical protein